MQCHRCGGWHYGQGSPPPLTPDMPPSCSSDFSRSALKEASESIARKTESDPYDEDELPKGDGRLWQPRIYGTDERGEEVTVSFGIEGTTREGHTMIADGHIPGWSFYREDNQNIKGHDHVGPGPQKDEFRGRYSGWEAFHEPDS